MRGRRRRVLAPEAAPDKQGNAPAMVQMRVGEQQNVDARRVEAKIGVILLVQLSPRPGTSSTPLGCAGRPPRRGGTSRSRPRRAVNLDKNGAPPRSAAVVGRRGRSTARHPPGSRQLTWRTRKARSRGGRSRPPRRVAAPEDALARVSAFATADLRHGCRGVGRRLSGSDARMAAPRADRENDRLSPVDRGFDRRRRLQGQRKGPVVCRAPVSAG